MMAKMQEMQDQLAAQMISFSQREDQMRREFELRESAMKSDFESSLLEVKLAARSPGGSPGGVASPAAPLAAEPSQWRAAPGSSMHVNRHGSIDIRGGELLVASGATAASGVGATPAPAAVPLPSVAAEDDSAATALVTSPAPTPASMPMLATASPEQHATLPSAIDYGEAEEDYDAVLSQEEYESRCDELLSSVGDVDAAVDAFVGALKAKADEAAELAAEAEVRARRVNASRLRPPTRYSVVRPPRPSSCAARTANFPPRMPRSPPLSSPRTHALSFSRSLAFSLSLSLSHTHAHAHRLATARWRTTPERAHRRAR